MKKGLLFLAVLTAFLFVSCEKDGLNPTERQLIGTWEYSKVKYTRNWSFTSADRSLLYEDIQLIFYTDYSAKYANTFTGETATGLWDLSQTFTDDDCINNIYASFTDDVTGDLRQVIFEDAGISNRTIRANYRDNEGWFRYVLRQE
jgi:hypothetical protein